MSSRGFTLVEVAIALSILCVVVLTVAQLVAVSVEGMAVSRAQTVSATLAAARLEQLRALAFAFDDTGARVTDLSTNLASDEPASGGGGLSGSGTDSLSTNTAGFVDYLDRHGRWVGNGSSPPASAIFVRRWSLDPLGGSPDALVVQVLVRPLAQRTFGGLRRGRGETRFVTILVRSHR